MKIGIITLTGFSNYGNRLQNYALQVYLNGLNVSAETILDKFYECIPVSYQWTIKKYIKLIINYKNFRKK